MKMKILVVSDREEPYIWDYFDMERFRDVDLVLSCGDLKAEYLSFLVTMIKAPLLCRETITGDISRIRQRVRSADGTVLVHKGIRV